MYVIERLSCGCVDLFCWILEGVLVGREVGFIEGSLSVYLVVGFMLFFLGLFIEGKRGF